MRRFRQWMLRLLARLANAEATAEIEALNRDLSAAAKHRQDQDAIIARLESDIEFLVEWRARELETIRTERKARQAAAKISELQERAD